MSYNPNDIIIDEPCMLNPAIFTKWHNNLIHTQLQINGIQASDKVIQKDYFTIARIGHEITSLKQYLANLGPLCKSVSKHAIPQCLKPTNPVVKNRVYH